MSRRAFYKSRWFQILVGVAITVGCFVLMFRSMTAGGESLGGVLRKIGSAFAAADFRTLPFMWCCVALFYWLKALRWRMLLAPVGDFDATRQLLPPIMVGFAVNNVAPLRLGEVMRVLVFARKQQLPVPTVLASVVVERILDVITILGLLALGISQLEFVDPAIRQKLHVASIVVGAAVVCGIFYLLWTAAFIRLAGRIMRRVPFVPERFADKFLAMLEAGNAGLASLRRPGLMLGIATTSLAQWLLNGLLIYFALTAFRIREPFSVSLVLLGVLAIFVAAPSVPGFFGIIQASFMVVLRAFEYPPETVFATSIYYHMAQYIPVTLIGLTCLLKEGFGVRGLRSQLESEAGATGSSTTGDANAAD